MVKNYFHFITLGEPNPIEVSEPWGSDAVGFSLKRDTGRKGIDTTFAGNGEANFTIPNSDEYGFDKLLTCWLRKGYEMNVKHSIDFGTGGLTVVGNIDGKTFKTDRVNEASFTVIQDSDQAAFKRRFDTAVDLLSDKDIKGNPITPCPVTNVLLKSPPVTLKSSWKLTASNYIMYPNGNTILNGYFNPLQVQVDYDIKDSLTWLRPDAYVNGSNDPADYTMPPQNFKILRAANNLSNIQASFRLHMKTEWTNINPPPVAMQVIGRFAVGEGDETFNEFRTLIQNGITFYNTGALTSSNQSYEYDGTFSLTLPNMRRGQVLYMVWIHGAGSDIALSKNTFYEAKLDIQAADTGYSTVIPMIRLGDAMKYAAKAASGLDVICPRWEFGGEFYNQFITTPSLMRKKYTTFNITNKTIYDEIIRPEVNGDYIIQPDSKIFVGIYEDFYRDFQCADFKQTQNEDYEDAIIEDTPNQFKLGFKEYASQKEITADNTGQITSGETAHTINNNNVEDTREVEVGGVRDGVSIRGYQQGIFELTSDEVSQDDDKVVIIDCLPKIGSTKFTETSQLRHKIDADVDNKLTLTIATDEGETFSWSDLGISITDNFNILNGDNTGQYTVFNIDGLDIVLLKVGGLDPVAISSLNTTYEYFVNSSVQVMNRTNEGFTSISGIDDPTRAVNLDWTVRRIMERFYKQSLGTDTFFADDKTMKNTIYKNNRAATINGIREDSDFTPSTPVLTPFTRTMTVKAELPEFFDMQNKLRYQRGYVRAYDPDGWPVDLFLDEANWTVDKKETLEGQIMLKGQEMYRQFLVDIIAIGGVVTFNNNITPSAFSFADKGDGWFEFFDATGKRLFSRVQYNRVRINGGNAASSSEELGVWLSQYSM